MRRAFRDPWQVVSLALAVMLLVPVASGGALLTDPSPEPLIPDPGSTTATTGEQETASTDADEAASTSPDGQLEVSMNGREFEVTRTGQALLAPFDSAEGQALVRLHQYGTVAAMSQEGDVLWERQSRALKQAWGAGGGIVVSRIYMGPVADPLRTYHDESAQSPVATHDVTGDGIEEIMVVHNLVRGDRPNVYAALSLLDGANGEVLWFHLYRGVVTGIAFTGDTLVVAEENGDPLWDPDGRWHSIGEFGGASVLHGLSLEDTGGGVEANVAWQLQPPSSEWARWTGPITAGPGVVSIAHTPDEDSRSTLFTVDVVSGQTLWASQRLGVVDLLRYDADRRELVFTQRAPEARVDAAELLPGSPFGGTSISATEHGFSLVAASVEDGTPRITTPVQHTGVAHQLALGDVTGDGLADWVVSGQPVPAWTFGDAAFSSHPPPPTRSLVTVLDGETGVPLWQRTAGAAGLPEAASQAESVLAPTPVNISGAHGLAIVEGSVVVGSMSTNSVWIDNRHLQVFEGQTGTMAWMQSAGKAPSPSSLLVDTDGGQAVIRGVSLEGVYRTYALEDGRVQTTRAILTDPNTAILADVSDEQTRELVLGSTSGGVFAIDATPIPREDPMVHWQSDLDGPVHELVLADVTGDGVDEIVAVAENEVAVLDAATGHALVRIPYPEAYVWTVSLADVDGDGALDLIVPADTMDAYRGSDGTPLWTYEPPASVPGALTAFSTAAIVEGTIVAQIAAHWHEGMDPIEDTGEGARASLRAPTYHEGAIVGIQLATGAETWSRSIAYDEARVALWRSVVPAPTLPMADGHAAAIVTHAGTDPVEAVGSALGSGSAQQDTVLRIIDARTGQPVGDPQGLDVHRMGLKLLANGQVIVLTNDGLFNVTSQGLNDLPYRQWSYWGVDVGSFGAAGELIAAAPITTGMLLPTDVFTTGAAPVAEQLATVDLGQAVTGDLDHDGVDEVIAFGEDDRLYSTLAGFTGRFFQSVDVEIKGVAVLDVSTETSEASP